jgi:hypothetical protein
MEIRRALLLVTAFLSLGLAACATGFKATYDSDPSHDFSSYQTYAWISENPMIVGPTDRVPNPLLEPRIMATVERGLTTRGFSKVDDPEAADFVLSFTVGSREEIKVDSYPATYAGYGYRGAWGWGGPYYGYGMATETQVRQYQKGMLALDVFDVKEHRPVFHAVAEKSITESDRKKMDETIQAAVDAVLAAFPPQ